MERISDLPRSYKGIIGNKHFDKPQTPENRACRSGKQRNLIQVSTKVCSKLRSQIYPLIKLKRRHNTVYDDSVFLDVLTHTALTQGFTEGGSKTFQIMHPDSPHVNTVLHHIKKFDKDEVGELFRKVSSSIISQAKKLGILKGHLDVAIDITDELFYGDKNTPMIIGTKPGRGTTYAYKYATLTIVEKGRRFTVSAVPLNIFSTLSKAVETLIIEAKRWISINLVMMDRAFNSTECIHTLDRLGVKYLMPAKQTAVVKKAIESGELTSRQQMKRGHGGSKYYEGLKLKTVDYNLLVVKSTKNPEKMASFATNVNVEEEDVEKFINQYSKRWGIETAYRVQDKYRVRTTSKNYIIRLFYFMFGIMLYNLWVLVNTIVLFMLHKSIQKPVLNTQMVAIMITKIDYG